MTTVNGTANSDFIHVTGDSRVPPGGYHEITYDPAGTFNLINPGAGADIVYGSIISDGLVVTEVGDISGLSEVFDGGGGLDGVDLNCNGVIDLSAATLVSVEAIGLTGNASGTCEAIVTTAQLSGFHLVVGNALGFEGFSSIISLAAPGTVSVKFDDARWVGFDRLNGSSGDDRLDITALASDGFTINGAGGNDRISFSYRPDFGSNGKVFILQGGDGDDTLSGGRGTFVLDGGTGKDRVTGGGKDDTLFGGKGADVLTGSQGADILSGGSGQDQFLFKSIADSAMSKSDTISDFSQAQGDLIDLSRMDADTTLIGNQAFQLGGDVFTLSAGELIQFSDGSGHSLLQGDVDGDGLADFEILLDGAPVLTAGDFFL